MTTLEYWKECISIAADECGMPLSEQHLNCLAEAVESGHDNYGQAFYSPPASDRISDIEEEWKLKLKRLENELQRYKENAETAIKQALRRPSDELVSIGEYGEVLRHGGRTERIQ